MSFTAKIRVYLIAVALIPPLAVMSVIYFHSVRQAEEADRQHAMDEVRKYNQFRHSYLEDLKATIRGVAAQPVFGRALMMLKMGNADRVDLSSDSAWLDFLEIIDDSNRVLVSAHRPALVGDTLKLPPEDSIYRDDSGVVEAVEYDRNGPHAVLAAVLPLDSGLRIYAGNFLDKGFLLAARMAVSAEINIRLFDEDKRADFLNWEMDPNVMYLIDDKYQAVLGGGRGSGYYLTASVPVGAQGPALRSLVTITGLVAAASALVAIALGFYISHKAKKEIENLLTATARIASGDLSTTVMAYEEGEFSQLADSLSDMVAKLKSSQENLAYTGKIAAWQVMGRKIAHEVKNPLTPIAICADDLRRSYYEKLPDFQSALDRNTVMIKSEVQRLTNLLDQFVGFARMAPPAKQPISIQQLLNEIASLHKSDIESGRITLDFSGEQVDFRLDPEQFKQLLINLIKNGLESAEGAGVDVSIQQLPDRAILTVLDSGPGFSEEKLKRGFEPYTSSKRDGSGLGLVICQRIALDHGGSIELFNRTEGGAGVRATLPAE